jgi:hypothetical protein
MKSYVAAGILALAIGAAPLLAQSSQQAPPPQTPEKPAQKPQEKPKKVWTDDDLTALRSTVNITTATATPPAETAEGTGEAGAAGPAAAPAAGGKQGQVPPEKTAKFYQDKLTPLRAKLAEAEAKIKAIQDVLNNPSRGGSDHVSLTQSAPPGPAQQPGGPPRPDDNLYGNTLVRPEDQLAYYQKQRDDLQQQIDALEAEAIRNGLTRGEIQ